MPRYKENIADIITERVNIIDVISSYTTLTRAGRNHKALCPFHSEKTPSFIVSEEKQLYHCFGCGQAGSVIQFVMNKENLSFIETIEQLAERYHIDLSPYVVDTAEYKRDEIKTDLYPILREAAKYYYKALHQGENAGIAYLNNRGLSPEIIRSFGLGYAAEGWANLIQHFKGTGVSYQNLLDVGLIIRNEDKDSYYDRFRNRVMFPIFDNRGRIVGFGGRVLDDSKPKYLNSPETSVFNKSKTLYGLNIARQNIGPEKRVLLAEGYMDVIALHQAGYRNAVATLGTAITRDHGQMLARIFNEVVIVYDSDEAGQTAAQKAIEILKVHPVKVKVLTFVGAKDPDEFIQQFGVNAFERALNEAQTAFEFLTQVLRKKYDLSKPEEKLDFIQAAITMLKDAKNPIEQEYYINHIASQTGISPDLILQSLAEQKGHSGPRPYEPRASIAPQFSGEETRVLSKIESALLCQVLSEVDKLQYLLDKLGTLIQSRDDQFSHFVLRLRAYYDEFSHFSWEDAAQHFEVEDLALFHRLSQITLDRKEDLKAFDKLILSYEKAVFEQEIKTIDQRRMSLNTLPLDPEQRRVKEAELLRKRDLAARELSRVIKAQTKS